MVVLKEILEKVPADDKKTYKGRSQRFRLFYEVPAKNSPISLRYQVKRLLLHAAV